MSDELDPQQEPAEPTIYQIRLRGHLGREWAEWFANLTITLEDGDTLLTGPALDQAALYGLLKKVRDLGLPLISVSPVKADPAGNQLNKEEK